MLTFLFAALTMTAVGKAAIEMVEEVRRQFREIPGIMEKKAKPDYKRCVEISTHSSLKQMILPGVLAIVAPVVVGVWSVQADRKSTRLNSSHANISYAVFCLKKKNN